MARIEYTWSKNELYNKDGIQIFIIRCNEDNRKKTWEIVENGVARKATHADVSPYIDPDYATRKPAKIKNAQRGEQIMPNMVEREVGRPALKNSIFRGCKHPRFSLLLLYHGKV